MPSWRMGSWLGQELKRASSINKNGISIKIKTEVTGELIGEIDIPEGVARIPIRDLEELISDAILMAGLSREKGYSNEKEA